MGSARPGGRDRRAAAVGDPVLKPDVSSWYQGGTKIIDVLANDDAAGGETLDPATLTLIDNGAETDRVDRDGVGRWVVAAGKITFTPDVDFLGTAAPVTYQVGDEDQHRATSTLTSVVTATVQPDTSVGAQGDEQSVHPFGNDDDGTIPVSFTDDFTLIDPDSGEAVDEVTVPGQGTYTVAQSPPDVIIRFAPLAEFTGPATPVTYQRTGVDGSLHRTTYTPTVTADDPSRPTARPDVSTGKQGAAQSVAPLVNDVPAAGGSDLDPATLTLLDGDDPVDELEVGDGTYRVAGVRIRFTPNAAFVGAATPVTYGVADGDDRQARSTYSPKVTRLTVPDAETSRQGVSRYDIDPLANDTVDPDVTLDGSRLVLIDPRTGRPACDPNDPSAPCNPVVLPDQATFSADGTGIVTVEPRPGFVGTTDDVTYRVPYGEGEDSVFVESTLHVTFTPVAPSAVADVADGPAGQDVTIDPLANDLAGDDGIPLDLNSPVLLDEDSVPVDPLVVAGEGSWSVLGGLVTFTPLYLPDAEPLQVFTGTTTPVRYQMADVNGQTSESTITVTIRPLARDDETRGFQGAEQSVDPLANDVQGEFDAELDPSTLTLVDDDGGAVTELTVAGEGTYELVEGRIVFTPEPDFIGTGVGVAYQVANSLGIVGEAFYTPTVERVKPLLKADRSTGPQGLVQSVDPLANDGPGNSETPLVPASLTLVSDGQPVDDVAVDGQGRYAIEDGRIVFTPVPAFVGRATPVRYLVQGSNDEPATATYTPTTTAVVPELRDDRSSAGPDEVQSVEPLANDRPGDPRVPLQPETLTLVVAGQPADVVERDEGSYALRDGVITFTPALGFFGEPDPVRYRVADANGTRAGATYRPDVTFTSNDFADPDDIGTVRATGVPGRPVTFDLSAAVPGLIPGAVALADASVRDDLTAMSGSSRTSARTASQSTGRLSVAAADEPAESWPGSRLRARNQGVWSVDTTSTVTFTPVTGLRGDPDPIVFVGVRDDGTLAFGTLVVDYSSRAAPSTPGSGPIAETGASSATGPLLGTGAVLLVAGAVLLIVRRRRTRP